MREKIIRFLDNIFVSMIVNLIWNFGLWFLLSVLLFSEEFSWARFFYFLSNSHHLAVIIVVITLIGKWTSVQPKSYLPLSNPEGVLSKAWGVVQNIFWFIIDLLNFFFWLVFDCWRKPSVEVFTRMSVDEVVKAMIQSCNREIEIAELNHGSPITGYFSKSCFSLLKWSPTPYGKLAVINGTILYGRIYDVKKGVFIRAWHRLPTAFLIFITAWLGGFTGVVLGFGHLPVFAFVILEIIGSAGWLLFIMWISTLFAAEQKKELTIFLKNIFSPVTVKQNPISRRYPRPLTRR
jgi:hypothetical protein